jgi:hypothetical protein
MRFWKMCGAVICGLGIALVASNAQAASGFDKPLKTIHVPLPKDHDNPQAKPEVACFLFPHFMVKQIDLGEVGADQLSIDPSTGRVCQKKNSADEKIVSPRDWSGYFGGVKSDFVVFDADDGWNDGLGFAVFDPATKKLFEDVQKKWIAIDASQSTLKLHYVRVYGAKCSLMSDKTCWQQIERDTGMTGAAPDCAALYRAEQKRVPKFAKETLADPTVIDYEVTATIDAHGHKLAPVTGKALRCRPAE